jgi:hypothetical protein
MLKKPDIDERTTIRLFLVIKVITESIMNLVLKGIEIDDIVKLMEEEQDAEETNEKISGIAMKRLREGGAAGQGQEQLEADPDEQAKF